VLVKSASDLPTIDLAVAVAAPARPTNYTRSVFHVASGAFALALMRLLPGRGWLIAVSGGFALWAWSMEFARRRSKAVNEVLMRFFAPIAHAHERHRVNSSTWYTTALLLLSLLLPLRAAEVGVMVLALADPAAGFIGRRYGRTRLRAGRSLEGSLAFFAVGAGAALGWLMLVHGQPGAAAFPVALAAAAAGALAELGPARLDDNFTIPLAAAAAAAAAQMLS
jgi:dolichol kinase